MAADDTPPAYDALVERSETLTDIQQTSMLLNWDQQVMMPPGGRPARASQLSTLSALSHELLTESEVADWLDQLEDAALDDEQQAVVRELRHRHDRAADVPGDLVERISEHQSNAQGTWQEAKADADFDAFAPALETLRDLQVDRAEHVDPDASPYVVMYEDGERDIPLSTVEDIFDTIREELVPLVDEIRERGDDLATPFEGTYPEADQEALSEAALDYLGYDRDHGRLDTAPHPFMSGNQYDARVTTRFKEDDPIDALTATIHEFGHASYQLGLREDEYGTPLGASRSSGVHESQSRFWENHVGRTKAFWEGFLPTLKEHLDGHDDLTVDEAYQAVNQIYPENRIRVEADELTYHMHIVLRCEIDRAFVEGDLAVDEIPETWNEKMDDYLGVVPDDDAEGCLQDIHWSYGFAGFQSYTIGSVLAAQLDHAMRQDVADVDEKIRTGEFGPLREWMEANVHRHGQRYRADELVEVATGEPLTAEYFVDYAREKFTDLYGL